MKRLKQDKLVVKVIDTFKFKEELVLVLTSKTNISHLEINGKLFNNELKYIIKGVVISQQKIAYHNPTILDNNEGNISTVQVKKMSGAGIAQINDCFNYKSGLIPL